MPFRVKCAAVFQQFGASKQIIKKDLFVDQYLTKSLVTDSDFKFKVNLLAEWLISVADADSFIKSCHPGTYDSNLLFQVYCCDHN